MSKSLDMVLKDSFSLVDIPMVMVTEKSKIIWQNNCSNHMLPKDIIEETSIKLQKQKQHSSVLSTMVNVGQTEVYNAWGTTAASRKIT